MCHCREHEGRGRQSPQGLRGPRPSTHKARWQQNTRLLRLPFCLLPRPARFPRGGQVGRRSLIRGRAQHHASTVAGLPSWVLRQSGVPPAVVHRDKTFEPMWRRPIFRFPRQLIPCRNSRELQLPAIRPHGNPHRRAAPSAEVTFLCLIEARCDSKPASLRIQGCSFTAASTNGPVQPEAWHNYCRQKLPMNASGATRAAECRN
jgi:hypothetical protein